MRVSVMVSLAVVLAAAGAIQASSAETIKHTMEGGMDVEITHPDSVITGREYAVSFLIQNNGWEDKEQVTLLFDSDDAIIHAGKSRIEAGNIAAGGSYGDTLGFTVSGDAPAGIHYINLDYSHVLLENNETPREAARTDIAIALDVKEYAGVNIHTTTPDSVFAGTEFPFRVWILSEDVNISDVVMELLAPDDMKFRGQTLHTFSTIQSGDGRGITSRVATPPDEIHADQIVPFQVRVTYTDDMGEQRQDSKTVSIILRPRTFMELTTDGGIWIGDLFIAPYVSIGTLIGVPAGTILSLAIRRRRSKGGAAP